MMESMPPPLPESPGIRPWRLLLLLAVLAAALTAAFWLRQAGPTGMPYACAFNRLTGWHCPGCGMTRAAHLLLNGRPLEAVRMNPVGMLVLPPLLALMGTRAVFWAFGWRWPAGWVLGKRGAITIGVLLAAFLILRNLPWWPFTLLAPH